MATADTLDPEAAAALAEALRALAAPTRLQLLRDLRTPKTVTEVEVRVAGRLLARQTVKQHLDLLVAVGVVVARPVERGRGATVEYVVNHQMLFTLGEDLRALARLRPSELPAGLTQVFPPPAPAGRRAGPRLLLVKGLDEGQAFELRPPARGPPEWTIGRRRGLAVVLDFDAAVSAENTRIAWDGERHLVEDLPHSRNGTLLNFRPLEKGVPQPLRAGDVVSVGRSSLVFQA
jgi:DNA-binding transcriptional ArsR family regulator